MTAESQLRKRVMKDFYDNPKVRAQTGSHWRELFKIVIGMLKHSSTRLMASGRVLGGKDSVFLKELATGDWPYSSESSLLSPSPSPPPPSFFFIRYSFFILLILLSLSLVFALFCFSALLSCLCFSFLICLIPFYLVSNIVPSFLIWQSVPLLLWWNYKCVTILRFVYCFNGP